MEIQPSGAPDQAQQTERMVAARAELDLARFKKLIETHFHEIDLAQRARTADAAASGRAANDGDADHAAANHDHSGHGHRHEHENARRARHRGRNPLDWLPHPPGLHGNPLTAMRKVGEEVDHLVERVLGRPLGMPSWMQGERHWSPQVEVTQHGDEVVICADLPGIKSEDVRLEIRRDRLTIEGDRHAHLEQQEQRQTQHTERAYGHFYREIPLPEGADADAAAASMHDGVLEIKMPLLPEPRRARRIEIKTGR